MHPILSFRALISVFDPGYDTRTLLTVAVAIPMISSVVYGAAKIFGRAFRWVSGVVADALVAVVVAAIKKELAPHLDSTEGRLVDIEEVLVTVNKRLGILETRRRRDRAPYDEEH